MREWHHVNLRSNQKSKTIPSNTLVTSSNNQESHIIYEGSYDEVLGIANGLPGSSSVPACWLMRGNWKEIFPLLSEPSFKWVTTDQEGLSLTKICKTLTSDCFKMPTQSSREKQEESLKRNPYLPLPPPPLLPHPDEVGVNDKDEDKEEKEAKEEHNQEEDDVKEGAKEKEVEGRKEIFDKDNCNREEGGDDGEDYNEEDDEEFVDGNISDWLEY